MVEIDGDLPLVEMECASKMAQVIHILYTHIGNYLCVCKDVWKQVKRDQRERELERVSVCVYIYFINVLYINLLLVCPVMFVDVHNLHRFIRFITTWITNQQSLHECTN